MERRDFLRSALLTGVAGAVAGRAEAQATATPGTAPAGVGALPRVQNLGELKGEMLYRELGTTRVTVSAIGLGGSHIGKPALSDNEAIRLMHAAIDRGITFMDNCWDYNDGTSEQRMGDALSQDGYRDKAFLMTKIDGRTKELAAKQIDTSLRRLKTDRIDLLQHHEILRFDDPDRIFGEGGAMEAFLDAKKAGKLRFIGFTGHKDPHVHLYMLEVARKHGFHFDTVQMPINVMDAHFRSFAQLVVPKAIEEGIGVLGMKTFGGADGVILKSGAVDPLDALHYSLTIPTSVVITGIDNEKVLDQAFQAAKTFKPLTEQQIAAILGKTAQAAQNGRYELFKTSAHFDQTARHADWLGGDLPNVKELAPQNAG